jgi:hypothetical protein
VIPIAFGGADAPPNVKPIHIDCHKDKTRVDARNLAKAKRVAAKHTGQYRRPKHSVGGGKNSAFKKKLNGEVVWRSTGERVT